MEICLPPRPENKIWRKHGNITKCPRNADLQDDLGSRPWDSRELHTGDGDSVILLVVVANKNIQFPICIPVNHVKVVQLDRSNCMGNKTAIWKLLQNGKLPSFILLAFISQNNINVTVCIPVSETKAFQFPISKAGVVGRDLIP